MTRKRQFKLHTPTHTHAQAHAHTCSHTYLSMWVLLHKHWRFALGTAIAEDAAGAAGLTTISHKLSPLFSPAPLRTPRFKRSTSQQQLAALISGYNNQPEQAQAQTQTQAHDVVSPVAWPTKSSRATEEEANDPNSKMTGQHTRTHTVCYHLWVAAPLT